MPTVVSLLGLIGPILAADVAVAAIGPEPYALSYRAVPGCPDEAALRADVATHVQDADRASGVRIEIEIRAAEHGFGGAIVTVDRRGNQDRRELGAVDCAELAHAFAFLAGVAIDLGAREPRDVVMAASAPPAPAPPPAAPPPVSRSFAVAALGMGALRGGLAAAPRPAAEIGLTVEDARGRVLAPAGRLAVVGGGGDIRGARGDAELWLLAGRLDVCPVRGALSSSLEVRPCAGVEIGAVRARATTLINSPTLTRLWAAAEATISVRLPLGRTLFAEIDASVVFPFERDRYFFGFQPSEAFYTVPWVTGSVAVGAGARF